MDAERALWRTGSSPTGLTAAEAAVRLAKVGRNALPEPRRRPLARRLLETVTHFMALLLWVAGALAMISGLPELAWAIWAVIVLNGAFGFWQEVRAERALNEIARLLPARARVVRGGASLEIPVEELVPGDLVELAEGDRVSADARLLEAKGLRVDLSMLTGESEPVARTLQCASEDSTALEAEDVVLAGSTIASGHAVAVVWATGARTVLGGIASMTARVRRARSTLEEEVVRIVRVVTVLALVMGTVVFVLAWWLVGMDVRGAFLFGIGIVVANVPEGLLPLVTLSLAMGARRMARRNALVRRLSALETLSAIDVICTDKTGTLTTNHMTLRRVWVPDVTVEVRGEVGAAHDPDARHDALDAIAAASLCCELRGRRAADPTEQALLDGARSAGLHPDDLRHRHPRLHELPFDSWRRCMTVVVRDGAGARVVTKGGPAEVLARCGFARRGGRDEPLTPETRARVMERLGAFAKDGHRVLAVAERRDAVVPVLDDASTLERDLVLLGLVALLDPPRPEVAEAVAACRRAGIRVAMVTGDHEQTARAVGRVVGLCDERSVFLSGRDLEAMDDRALRERLATCQDVHFARVLPEHKLRIVMAHRALGAVVAVTGDGVNDAPALRAAHVGIAMGRSGTDVARQAADVVLLDDHFATIVSAIEEGRALYANIRKFLTYILASNVPEIVPFLAMVGLRIPPALTVLQILAVDLGTDMAPALALGGEAPEPGTMDGPPRSRRRSLLDRALLLRAYAWLGILEAALAMGAFALTWRANGIALSDLPGVTAALLEGAAAPELALAWRQACTATFLTIVACQLGNLLQCRSERRGLIGSGWPPPLVAVGVAIEIAIVAILVLVPPIADVFELALPPASLAWWIVAAPVVLVVLEQLRKRTAAPAR